MGITLDFSNVPKREPLPEGIYNVVCEAVEEKTSKTGKPMLVARFQEVDTKTSIFENFLLTPDALWKLQSFCTAIGFDAEGQIDTDDLTAAMLGAEVQVKVVQREYQGNITNNIKSYIMG